MNKPFVFFIVLLFILSLLNDSQVQCWSEKQKEKASDENQRGQKNRQATLRPLDQIERELERLNKNLDVEIHEESGIPKTKYIELNKVIEQIQEFIDKEQDEEKKKFFENDKKSKIEEMNAKITEEKRKYDAQFRRRDRVQKEYNEQKENQDQKSQEKEQVKQEREQDLNKKFGNKKSDDNAQEEKIEIEEEVKAEENMADWLQQWEEQMDGFKADDMISFEVNAKGYEVFLEEVKKPCTIRGAFFINFDSKEGIELKIMDPDNKQVDKLVGKKQGIFKFQAETPGTYQFYFQNRQSKNKKQVSFAVDVSDNEYLQKEDIDSVTTQFREVHRLVKTQLSSFKTLRRKNRSIGQTRESNATKVFVFTILETIFIVGCTIFQVLYIKKILDHRSFV